MELKKERMFVLTLLVRSVDDAQQIIDIISENHLLAVNRVIEALPLFMNCKTTNVFANVSKRVPAAILNEIACKNASSNKEKKQSHIEESNRFMGLEELFWENYGIHPKM